MTFSLIAHCAESGQFGVAATTAVPAVGKLVTHAAPGGWGAVATQARVNPYLGVDGLTLLREGKGGCRGCAGAFGGRSAAPREASVCRA